MNFSSNLISLLLLFSAISASGASVNNIGESDTDKVIRYTESLEREPFQELAPIMRKWLIKWAEESPDVIIVMCDILGPVPGKEIPFSPELLVQSAFGNAAYQVSHPQNKDDFIAVQLAGVESVLKAYNSIITAKPEARISYFDSLLEKHKSGTLAEFMTPIITKNCKNN